MRKVLAAPALFVLIVGAVLLGASVYRAQAGGKLAAASPRYSSVQAALRAYLDRQYLSYRWVVCTPIHRSYRGSRLSRCNVDFGSPHIVPYCAALVNGALVTDRENKALDCGGRVKADEQDSLPTLQK